MKLKRRITPSAILTADWHIRADTPECRTDNFLLAQEKKVKFIVDLAKKYNCPILIAGDIGNKHQWPNWLLRWFAWVVKDVDIIAIPGQHDLPGHRLDQLDNSAQGVLSITDVIDLRTNVFISKEKDFELVSYPYSLPIVNYKKYFPEWDYMEKRYPTVAITHQMIIKDKLWPDQVAPRGNVILKKFPEYDLILSGDNHTPFIEKCISSHSSSSSSSSSLSSSSNLSSSSSLSSSKGRILVNPGSIMRSTAAQIDHKPRVYLWYASTNKVKPVYLPIEKGVVSRDHIEQQEEQDERRNAYVARMKTDYEISFSYEGNLEKHIEENNVEKEVGERIWEMIE